MPQQHRHQNGGRELKEELPPGGEAGILMVDHLHVIIDEANGSKDQSEQENIKSAPVSLRNMAPAHGHRHHTDGGNKHQPAHGGGPLLGHVPGGTDLLDGLARMECPQRRNKEPPDDHGEDKAHRRRCGHGDNSRIHRFASSALFHLS